MQGSIEFRSALHLVSLITADGSIYWRTQQRCFPETLLDHRSLRLVLWVFETGQPGRKRDRRLAQLRRIFFILGLPGDTSAFL